jgi:hypothetical protein
MLMFVVGSMILFGGFYYRKQIIYNSIYAYVILENNIKNINNKYFRNQISVYNYDPNYIIEIFDTNFTKKRYKLFENVEYLDNTNLSMDFNSKSLFLSVELQVNLQTGEKTKDITKDITKDVNLFITKNSELLFNYNLAVVLNKFLDLQLKITEDNYTWKILDNGMNIFEGNELLFKIDENYFLTFIN